ncbi:hypothetical protein L1049_001458 [Liquidambar formosana]|uniref:Protein SQS1 n=1 Tax=Liquidambar formosana TaxID=63359 RepID=A0AAP0NAX9_LIQFO
MGRFIKRRFSVVGSAAAVCWGEEKVVKVEEIQVEPPRRCEIRMKIIYASFCHTDVLCTQGFPTSAFPRVLGHEGVGVVESIGEEVTNLKEGDIVIPTFIGECKECENCRSGKTNLCEKYPFLFSGLMPDETSRMSVKGQKLYHFFTCSTWSEYTVVNINYIVKVDPSIALPHASLLSCGFTTGFGGGWKEAKVEKGSSVAVFGLGAVGLGAIKGAQMKGATRIIGIDKNERKKEKGLAFGMTEFVNPSEHDKSISEIIKELTGGTGVDYCIECTGVAPLMNEALEACKVHGIQPAKTRPPVQFSDPVRAIRRRLHHRLRAFVPLRFLLRRRNPNGSGKSGSRSGNPDRSMASGSKSGSRKTHGNVIRYEYPAVDPQEGLCPKSCMGPNGDNALDESHPIMLVDSKENKIFAYVDQTPSTKPLDVEYTYDYSSALVLDDSSHRGLGFSEDPEATPSGIGLSSKKTEEEEESCSVSSSLEKEIDADGSFNCEIGGKMFEGLMGETLSPWKNSGFLSIGGMKLYTQDISDEEGDMDDDGELPDEESSGSSEPSSESDDSEDMSNSDSDVDDEVALDYVKGIGGGNKVTDVNWLEEQVLDVSDDDSSSDSSIDGTIEKLGGIALQDASREYGMRKPSSRKKYPLGTCKSGAATDAWSLAIDDLMLVKDPRMYSGKRRNIAGIPKSWPPHAQKNKNFRNYPGEKKKHRKEMIALKRRERMMSRGVDLEQINLKLEQMVLDEVDILSFQPMQPRDCSQVRRLAAIYRLRSGCQGSGKKRFVTVTRTDHTCMPSSIDKLRLEKLIGAGNEDADFVVNDLNTKVKKASKGSGFSPLQHQRSVQSKSSKKSANHYGSSKMSEKKSSGRIGSSYANQPVSFVSSGTMQSDTVEIRNVESKDTNDSTHGEIKGVAGLAKFGAFEVHTKGFGSKMMAKMGFVEGGGLGKDGQGVAVPIEVIKRPKSLGLGVQFSETAGDEASDDFSKNKNKKDMARSESQRIGGFEKHTKGFGSKMMAKMGFVEGLGLGKDSQGIVNPLVPVRLPKSLGLGAKSKS